MSGGSLPRPKKLWGDNKDHNPELEGRVSEHGWYMIEVKSRPSGSEFVEFTASVRAGSRRPDQPSR
ncbi:MAG: hypothetical protein JOZ63_14100 [Planctomycetaceae bacterium]|nr:hypothetical protein [Planctomycetaceae bacterium]